MDPHHAKCWAFRGILLLVSVPRATCFFSWPCLVAWKWCMDRVKLWNAIISSGRLSTWTWLMIFWDASLPPKMNHGWPWMFKRPSVLRHVKEHPDKTPRLKNLKTYTYWVHNFQSCFLWRSQHFGVLVSYLPTHQSTSDVSFTGWQWRSFHRKGMHPGADA